MDVVIIKNSNILYFMGEKCYPDYLEISNNTVTKLPIFGGVLHKNNHSFVDARKFIY